MNISVVQSMINAVDKPAIFIDTQYTILAVNQAYRETYENEVVLGNSRCFEISHGNTSSCDNHGEDCPIQTCMQTQKATSVMHVHNTEFGKTYCDILMKPIKDDDGITIGFLEVLDKIDFATTESHNNKMIGSSTPFKAMLSKINRAAKADISVLLHGETGTGKELVAKALHDSSSRATKPFVVIECTGLNENLFESELFGHEKGAFTGAVQNKKGLIEVAKGGTVFFDEIADVSLSMQVKLLRLIETRSYRTVGGTQQKKADFRLICASHKNLFSLVQQDLFRKDLYYRIAGFPISLPSLSERQDDIPALCQHFLISDKVRPKKLSQAALKRLCEYDYPGNIRELKNIVEQATLLTDDDVIELYDLPEQVSESPEPKVSTNFSDPKSIISLETLEYQYLSQLCEHSNLDIDALALQLGISVRTLYRKFQKHGLKFE